jgi:hypothetical protein
LCYQNQWYEGVLPPKTFNVNLQTCHLSLKRHTVGKYKRAQKFQKKNRGQLFNGLKLGWGCEPNV